MGEAADTPTQLVGSSGVAAEKAELSAALAGVLVDIQSLYSSGEEDYWDDGDIAVARVSHLDEVGVPGPAE